MKNMLHKEFFVALVISAFFVVGLCVFFDPLWQTNDDVAISMSFHGYGFSQDGGFPGLGNPWPHTLWAHFVRMIPSVNGFFGYSTATFASLIAVGTVVIFGLRKRAVTWPLTIALVLLLLTGPVLSPQFTVNAGLLSMSGVICAWLYQNDRRIGNLVAGCILAFLGFLVREPEFWIVMLVALPLLPWKTLLTDRPAKIAILSILIAIAGAKFIDQLSYQGDGWKEFENNKAPLGSLLDFGAAADLYNRPDIFSKYGYSPNDIRLLASWVFIDPQITDPDKLRRMLKELGPRYKRERAVDTGWASLRMLMDPRLLIGVVTAGFLLLLQPSLRIVAAWALLLLAGFMTGFLGRVTPIRVYIPIVSLLILAPLFVHQLREGLREQFNSTISHAGVLFLAILSTTYVVNLQIDREVHARLTRSGLVDFPKFEVFTWGSAFPFENAYPALIKKDDFVVNFKLYSLVGMTLAPSHVHFERKQNKQDLKSLLTSGASVWMVAQESQLHLLGTYCFERLLGTDSDYVNYVDNYPNLLTEYEKESSETGITKSEFGERHYRIFGARQGQEIKFSRQRPSVFSKYVDDYPDLLTEYEKESSETGITKSEFGERHYRIFGARQGRILYGGLERIDSMMLGALPLHRVRCAFSS